jgi:predicted transcriptional regulator
MNGHTPTTGGLPPISNAPYRIQQAGAVFSLMESMNLSRLHRRLFLLIDGQRSVPELANLTGRRVDEIMALLDDLQRLGLINK